MDEQTGEKRADAFGAPVAGQADLKQADLKPGRRRTDNVPRGIVLMVMATILFSGASAAGKWLVGIYPVGEVLFLRSFASFVACAGS